MTDLDRLDAPDAEVVLDFLAGTTGGANRPMPTQRQAIDATKRLRAAVRERDELRAGLDETQRFLEYLWSATGNRAPDLPVHDLFNEDDPIADDILTVLGRARMLVHGATPAALQREAGA